MIPEGHKFAYGAHHEANTSPPIILSYENTIVWDLRELISSSLKTLEVEEENRIVMRMESEMVGVIESWRLVIERREMESGNELIRKSMENVMIMKENELLRRENGEFSRWGGREMFFFFILFFMFLYIIIYK